MPRTSKARAPEVIDAPGNTIDHQALDDAGTALAQIAADVAAVEGEYGISLPYNLDLYIASIRVKAAESAQRLIEIGQMLILIRSREPAGTFGEALEQIGLGVRFAQRAMQTAAKLHGLPRLQDLGVSKALELLSEDDDTLAALESGGTLAGLTLDDVDCMTVRELKAALRAERQERDDEKQTDEEIIRAKDERINKLTRDKRKVETSPARDKVAELLADMDEKTVEAVRLIRLLVEGSRTIDAVYADDGDTIDPDVVDRIHQNVDFVADWLRQLAQIKGE